MMTSQSSTPARVWRKLIFLTVNTSLIFAHLTTATTTTTTISHNNHRLSAGLMAQATGSTPDAASASLKLRQQQQQQPQSQPQTSSEHHHNQQQQQQQSEGSALSYLQRYGYMQAPVDASNQLVSEESFSAALAEFQTFAGLPPTGLADNATLALMRAPRCGNTDKPPADAAQAAGITKLGQLTGARRRLKRYALQGSKWRRQELTYRISQYPTKFSAASNRRHEVDAQIERAFGIWSQVAPIDFVVRREGRVHIDIRFASGDHGDGDAFDGPGNTLAHAYFPQYGGDAHFDDQEYWTVDSYAGTNIFQVAAHELGHSLGLGHSNVREALMAPFYQKYKPNFKLHLDDVLAIQALYGEKDDKSPPAGFEPTVTSATATTTTTTTTTTSTTTQKPTTSNHHHQRPPIYKGKRRPAWGRGDEEPDTRGPTTTTTTTASSAAEPGDLPELPTNGIDDEAAPAGQPAATSPADLCQDSALDAVTRTEDGSTYVFKGQHYWLLTSEGLARNYPRPIGADWEGLPGNLDAALTWADGKTFFFKGNKYWRFRNRKRDLGYPKLISAGFAGVPDDVDAAFVWSGNGRTYFFKGPDYWRFDSKADPPVSGEYPRPIKVWLGVPAYVNAAFKWENNVTYFFKGAHYYRFNDRDFRVESRGRPAFPRPIGEWWFGCPSGGGAAASLAQRAPAGNRNFFAASAAAATPELMRRTPKRASLQQESLASAPAASADEWALLGHLGAAETGARPTGTHISDAAAEGEREAAQHHQPEAAAGVPGERATRAGHEPLDPSFVASINRRLAPPLGLGAPLPDAGNNKLEQAFRLGPPMASSPSSSAAGAPPTSAIFIQLIFMCTLIATARASLTSSTRRVQLQHCHS